MRPSVVDSTSPTLPVAAVGRALPKWLSTLLWINVLWAFVVFTSTTASVRFGCVDDVTNDELVKSGRLAEVMIGASAAQGRFYHAVPCHLWPYRLYHVDSPAVFSTVRALLFFAEIGLAGWLCGRIAHSATVGWLAVLFGLGALHLPTTFFAVLSYPTMAIGFSSLLASLHFHLNHLRRGSAASAVCSAVLFLHACFYLEIFVLYLPLFLALSWHAGHRSPRRLLRSALGAVVTAIAYLAVYRLFTQLHPSSYGGTRVAVNVPTALNALFRLTASVIPGFELLVHRTFPSGGGSLFKTMAEIREAFADAPFSHYLLALLQGTALAGLMKHAIAVAGRTRLTLMVAGACVLLPNLPVCLTERYQVWAYHREFPYIYSFYGYCALAGLLAFVVNGIAAKTRAAIPSTRVAAAAVFAAGLGALVSAKASNAHTLKLLRQWHNAPAAEAIGVSVKR